MIKIVSIGHASYDIYIQVEEFPKEGVRERYVNKLGVGGGDAGNVAYLLGKWGVSTTFAGVVGNDVFGTRIRKEFESVGIDLRYLETSYEKDTTISFIFSNLKNQSHTVFNVADEYVKLKKFDFDFQPDLVFLDGHDPYASKSTIERFPKAISIVGANRYNADIVGICSMANYIVCSVEFAEAVTKIKIDYNNPKTLVNLYDELRKKFENQVVVVTLGDHGALYLVENNIKVSPAIKVKVVDSTIARSVFYGAFCYGVAAGFDLEKTIKYANIAAGLSTQYIGTRKAIPKLDEVTRLYEKNS